jgi:soluble lytic murein transglycosylase-like protein
MKKTLFAGLIAGTVLVAGVNAPSEAACREQGTCSNTVAKLKKPGARDASAKRHVAVHKKTRYVKKSSTRKHRAHRPRAARSAFAVPGQSRQVVSLIASVAPQQGVPAWFALRIARVESGYNPRLRGAAGEYGVFQLKCATARGIGFRGDCSALLDPRVNVYYGVKHLALAMKSSRGNLRLAASKHNGGLGRRTEIRGYTAKIF